MSVTDYGEIVLALQKILGQAYQDSPTILNLAGHSLACKIDPNYYLAVEPAFTQNLAKSGARLPSKVRTALLHTGNILTLGPAKDWVLTIGVSANGGKGKIKACFMNAEFVDRALILYGGRISGLEVSDLRIQRRYQAPLAKAFEGKTPLHEMAFDSEPEE